MSSASRIPVLMYHRIGDSSNASEARYSISSSLFASHMSALECAGYKAVSIDAMVDWLEGKAELSERSFLLTFDDGYRGVYDHARVVLEERGWPYAVFLVSDLLGETDVWNRDVNPSGRTYPLLNEDEIRYMQRHGCSFHSHSRSHVSLTSLSDMELSDQLVGSRKELAALLGTEVAYFAYPYGQLDERVISATKAAGYRAAFSTYSGFNQQHHDQYRVRRLDVYGTDTPGGLLRKIRLGTNDGSLSNMVGYYLRRLTQSVKW